MHIRSLLALAGLAFVTPLAAQRADSGLNPGNAVRRDTAASADSIATADTVFLRVQRLAANGEGEAARALVQREFEQAPTASPRFIEALYWRAVVAATAADAERDLRTLIVDYPLSPWSVEALMRLAQLEMTRRDMDQALAHLNRVIVEHPNSPQRPRASFWIARVRFEQGQLAEACRQLGDAARTAPASQVELKNQIEYWSNRCAAADTAMVAAALADTGKHAAAAAATNPPAPASPAPPPKRQYTVQVGAYNTRSGAEALATSLREKGYESRVFGEIAPFRVRIGRYATRSEAEKAASKLNAKKITAFATEAEPQ
jgi:predicted negative regulator of RcsB-dependent stress response